MPLSDDQFEAKVHIEVKTPRAKINDSAVCERASDLNGGLKCEIEHPPAWGRGALMGCANYHAHIRFAENGSTWLIQVPRINSNIPQELIDYLIRSEYAALKFLETTRVPAPRAFGDAGQTLEWARTTRECSAGNKDKEKEWNGLADILIELKISAIASERFPVLSPSGPYDTAIDYYTSFVEKNMSLIADGQLFPSFPLNANLVFLYLKSQIQDFSPKSNSQSVENTEQFTEQFYIKHVDDKGDHLMVDEELNIIGIIDWQMARVVPADEAFGPSLVTAEMGYIHDGFSSMTIHDRVLASVLKDKREDDLADIMCKNEKLRKFFFGLDVDFSWDETLLLIRGIWATFGTGRGTDWESWKTQMLQHYVHDERLENIIESSG
ncbi:hypothetical protein FE257_005124 [Aspergillus nanangensis]|uniref:Aminoglycoside phosphotransferase domain-containing protein n=1 Tax=Aspergillus nanangensis TaxID=2582783 RepID=A0AAD4CAR0_ASPNN|nr:hypothetical protein FE257_005124 [Aspergillus nanangensis]